MTALHGLARNPALPPSLLEPLAAIPELGQVLARRNGPPPEAPPVVPDADGFFLLVCEDEVIHPDVFVAQNSATSPVALFRLTAHAEKSVRLALASRRDLPAAAYRRLVSDPDPEVAETAAANPSLPVAVMEELINSTT
ncbi:hypothetical protein [Lentzea flava]|uniref:Leucine rich repeat variant n=1 Tax=Lentzea flava TaxID=103732 RepID=A0ABQ2VCZ7_9PSEU|nr:hypothetical protein [Lentzea flava]MCP2204716.1 hypothetical protein [Lentzea flava]GGU80575.1 hypothetical protein GCM10010178_84140 [Lentzea flava]